MEICRDGSAWLAKFLSEKEETAGAPVVIISEIACEALIGRSTHTVTLGSSHEL